MTSEFSAFFTGKYEVAESGCWLWTMGKYPKGYGLYKYEGVTRKATHLSLIMSGSDRPSPKHCAMHICDVPACINPAHLRWGTYSENRLDCFAKGRANLFWSSGTPAAIASRERGRLLANEARRSKPTCKRGHLKNSDHYGIRDNGERWCKTCVKIDYELKKQVKHQNRKQEFQNERNHRN
jgi:hypothetical protein